MAIVFVSYESEDCERVRPLVDALIAAGLPVRWEMAIAGGAIWRRAIATELDSAVCVIVVWSTSSLGPDGHIVHEEAARAMRRGVYLLIRIDPVEPPLSFGPRLLLPLEAWRDNRDDPRFVDLIAAARSLPLPPPTASPSCRSPISAPIRVRAISQPGCRRRY